MKPYLRGTSRTVPSIAVFLTNASVEASSFNSQARMLPLTAIRRSANLCHHAACRMLRHLSITPGHIFPSDRRLLVPIRVGGIR